MTARRQCLIHDLHLRGDAERTVETYVVDETVETQSRRQVQVRFASRRSLGNSPTAIAALNRPRVVREFLKRRTASVALRKPHPFLELEGHPVRAHWGLYRWLRGAGVTDAGRCTRRGVRFQRRWCYRISIANSAFSCKRGHVVGGENRNAGRRSPWHAVPHRSCGSAISRSACQLPRCVIRAMEETRCREPGAMRWRLRRVATESRLPRAPVYWRNRVPRIESSAMGVGPSRR